MSGQRRQDLPPVGHPPPVVSCLMLHRTVTPPIPSTGDSQGKHLKATNMPFPPFPIWESVPPTTPVRDLYRTSLLLCTEKPDSAILLRCGSGLEDGETTIVYAPARHPSALSMMGLDHDTQIAEQAQLLLGDPKVHAVAVPPIAWKTLGGGLPRRTRIAAVISILLAVFLYLPPLALSLWVAVPLSAVLGLLVRLLLRERIPTKIGSSDDSMMTVDEVVERVMLSLQCVPLTVPEDASPRAGSSRWAPPVG